MYACADGLFVSVAPVERRFYDELLERIGLKADATLPKQNDAHHWPQLRERLAAVFASKTRAEWCSLLEGSDACFAPVLSLDEAAQHPHNVTRGATTRPGGVLQPQPAPRFGRTPSTLRHGAPKAGADTPAVLADWGFSEAEAAALAAAGAVAVPAGASVPTGSSNPGAPSGQARA